MAEKESSEHSEGGIIEERVELMVDPATSNVIQNPTKRNALFLKPSLNLNALPPKLPKIQSFSSSSNPNVLFLCLSIPIKGWQTWVEKLRVTHEPVWRKAGIFDAIKCSTYHIARVSDLILSLVEKWCPETNTFVFPWGEATVTLEDVYVLGGFSPLGGSVLSSSSPSLGNNVEQVEKKLIESYRKLMKTSHNLSQLKWQEHFMGCGNQIEHAGFLALWLARHVFAGKSTTIVHKAVLSMAARLSCGAKLAFGPVILASIYRDLTLLKRKIVGSVSGHSLRLTSPLHLVQVWAWERFPSLGPVPRMINCGEVRLTRWVSHVRKAYDDMEMCLDSSRETFRWRPYTMSLANWPLPRFYVDSGMRVDVDSHEDWKLFSRCLMVGQLVGLNCVEEYNPHRVALQFGFDQDIPEFIDRSLASCKLDCSSSGLKLYIPPRLHEGDVTHRYSNWWRAGSHLEEATLVGCKRKRMSKICDRSDEFDAIDVDGNARENQMEKLLPREESSRNVLQVCNHTRKLIPSVASDEFSSRNVLQVGTDLGINSQIDTTIEEDEVRNINHTVGECSNYSDHRNSHIEEKETEITILCSKAVGSDFAARHQNFATEVGKLRAMSPLRRQNMERNVVEHHVKTEVQTSGSLLVEDEPDEVLCEDKDPTNQAGIPTSGQLSVSNDDNPFVALCVQYELRISTLEREFSALLRKKY
ncbi:uncharacterized protein LOC141646879 [Silene latifolia]|uniref:uncharacterized protein LOC141646879 n=1 Tax=Silene latifolia TaxID=37657 RepID=UPI003D776ED2